MLIDMAPLRGHRDFRLLFIGQLVFGLLGGAYADRLNRRRLMLVCEAAMALIVAALWVNSLMPNMRLRVRWVAFEHPSPRPCSHFRWLSSPLSRRRLGGIGDHRSLQHMDGRPCLHHSCDRHQLRAAEVLVVPAH